MDLRKDSIRKLFFKYLFAAFGSSLISTIYGFVDMIVVGQYEGPDGTAALAVVAPLWNIIFSLGLLFGIGSSVLFGLMRGKGKSENEYFTAGFLGAAVVAAAVWLAVIFADVPIMRFFGADSTLMPLIERYILPIKYVIPTYLLGQFLSAYLRNDNAPGLATAAVLGGGILNIFGDVFFVFGLDMGMFGAGLATAVGNALSLLIMLTHFISGKNTLRLVRVSHLGEKMRRILTTGFSTFFIDVAMGIVTILMNRQIMAYLGTDALSVYGVIVNISTCVQCCAYSVGQASQPIISVNLGASQWQRIRSLLKYALYATAFFSVLSTAITMAEPIWIVRLFMDATPEVLKIAPSIIRTYGLSFILLPLNVFSTYYFQAHMKAGSAFAISVARGFLISGALILVLPMLMGGSGIWLAMPLTELVTAFGVIYLMIRYTRNLGKTWKVRTYKTV